MDCPMRLVTVQEENERKRKGEKEKERVIAGRALSATVLRAL
jgi:hypothetical protein